MIGIRQLARHLGLSIGTVSRALNDRDDVNAETRQRVLEAAAELGYSPNQSGRSLRRGRTDLVAMIVPSGPDDTLINTVFLSVLNGLKRRLGAHGLDLAMFVEDGREDRLAALRRVTERGIADALIIADTESVDPRVDYLLKLKRPFVTFGRTKTPTRHAFVDPDFDAAVEDAVGHLAALGHERIGLVLPDRPMHYLALVEAGYRRALGVHRLPVEEGLHLRRPAGERGGLEAADSLIGSDRPPTAVLVTELDACRGALSPARRARPAARARPFGAGALAGGAGAISDPHPDHRADRLDRDRSKARRCGAGGTGARGGRRKRRRRRARARPGARPGGARARRERGAARRNCSRDR